VLGDIAAQLAFLAIADVFTESQLEHVAARSLVGDDRRLPGIPVTWLAIAAGGGQPETLALGSTRQHPSDCCTYGLRLVYQVRNEPMAAFGKTQQTRTDDPNDKKLDEESFNPSQYRLRFY